MENIILKSCNLLWYKFKNLIYLYSFCFYFNSCWWSIYIIWNYNLKNTNKNNINYQLTATINKSCNRNNINYQWTVQLLNQLKWTSFQTRTLIEKFNVGKPFEYTPSRSPSNRITLEERGEKHCNYICEDMNINVTI